LYIVYNNHFYRLFQQSLPTKHAILTGIRPAHAQVAIGAGLDFSGIEIYLNVQQALERLSVSLN
jgi:hypothetical protein